jgi:DNA gyrase/topoisomerase IV subunit A
VLLDGKKVVENVSILQLVKAFVEHRKEVLTNKFTAEHAKNSARIHILEGLLGITNKIDAVIKLVRNADNKEEAAKELMLPAQIRRRRPRTGSRSAADGALSVRT